MTAAAPLGRLERIESILEIQQLAMRYALAMDSNDKPLMLSLWDERRGAQLPWLDLGVVEDSVIPSWTSAGPSVMLIGNHIVDVTDALSATGTVYCLVRIALGSELIEQTVLYRDEYARGDDGVWRFSQRRHDLFYGRSAGENPWDQRPAHWPRHQIGRGILPDAFVHSAGRTDGW